MKLKQCVDKRKDLHHKWLLEAFLCAQKEPEKGGSPHPKVKVGAIIVDAKGKKVAYAANRFAKGVDYTDPARYVDGSRSLWVNCAEQMAIAQATRCCGALKGSTLYVTLSPCAICAGLIAECGIKEVVMPKDSCRAHGRLKAKWKKSITIGLVKLKEAGVKMTIVDVPEISSNA